MAISIPEKLTIYAPKALVVISLLLGLMSLAFSALFWARFHIDIPLADSLRLLPTVESVVVNGWDSVSFQEWVAPYASAHRVAVGRLLMALEYKYLAGGNALLYLGTWLSIAALSYAYCKASRACRSTASDGGWFMLGIALIFVCSYTLTYNLIMPINALWYIGTACSAMSFLLLLLPSGQLSLPRALGACLFAVIAAYSIFTGLIACLVLAVLALYTRSKHGWWVAAVLLVFSYFYLHDVKSGQELVIEQLTQKDVDVTLSMHVTELFNTREKLLTYMVTFLSSPLSERPSLLSYVLVFPSVALILYGWVSLTRQWSSAKPEDSAAQQFYLAMATVLLITAFACFLGRGTFNAPTEPRYQTVVMLYWLSICGLLLHSLPARHDPRMKTAYMILVLLIPITLLYKQTEFGLVTGIRKSAQASEIEIATALGNPKYRDSSKRQDRFSPDYIRFEQFLSEHALLRPLQTVTPYPSGTPPQPCNSLRLKLGRKVADSSQPRTIKLTGNERSLQRFRRVTIIDKDGGNGYLYAAPAAPVSIASTVWGNTAWKGYYLGNDKPDSAIVVFESVIGPDVHCQLTGI